MANTVTIRVNMETGEVAAGAEKIRRSLGEVTETAERSSSRLKGLFSSVFSANLLSDFFQRGLASASAFFGESIKKAAEFQSAMRGLTAVATFQGLDAGELQKQLQSLDAVRNGLLSVGEASQAARDLIKSGFNLEQTIDLLNAFADSAAVGKSASLSFAQAVLSGAQGIATQSSELLNNVGIVTNLSTMLERAGFTLDDLTDKTKGAGATQALYNALLKETAAFHGQGAAFAESYEGKMAKLSATIDKVQVALGNAVLQNKGFNDLLNGLSGGLEKAAGSSSQLEQSVRRVGPALAGIAEAAVVVGGAVATTLNVVKTGFDALFLSLGALPKLARIIGAEIGQAITNGAATTIEGLQATVPSVVQSATGLSGVNTAMLRANAASNVAAANAAGFGYQSEAWKALEADIKRFGDINTATNAALSGARGFGQFNSPAAAAAAAAGAAPGAPTAPGSVTAATVAAGIPPVPRLVTELDENGIPTFRQTGGGALVSARAAGTGATVADGNVLRGVGTNMAQGLITEIDRAARQQGLNLFDVLGAMTKISKEGVHGNFDVNLTTKLDTETTITDTTVTRKLYRSGSTLTTDPLTGDPF